MLPPSLNFVKPNPNIDFTKSPFAVNTELRPWELKNGDPRRCGVSAFGFGGTNFHVVMEEYECIVTTNKFKHCMESVSHNLAPLFLALDIVFTVSKAENIIWHYCCFP